MSLGRASPTFRVPDIVADGRCWRENARGSVTVGAKVILRTIVFVAVQSLEGQRFSCFIGKHRAERRGASGTPYAVPRPSATAFYRPRMYL